MQRHSSTGCSSRCESRSAGGKATSGRYKKHDTARLSYISCVALPGLRWGKIPPAADWKMLFMPGDDHISGADRVAMDHWAEAHYRDPRAKKSAPGAIDRARQTTLLEWAAKHPEQFVAPTAAPRGAPYETVGNRWLGAHVQIRGSY